MTTHTMLGHALLAVSAIGLLTSVGAVWTLRQAPQDWLTRTILWGVAAVGILTAIAYGWAGLQ